MENDLHINKKKPRKFTELTPMEVLALAIQIEEANVRRFTAFAVTFRGYDNEVMARFVELSTEEEKHAEQLLAIFKKRFGDQIPVIDEWDVDLVIESMDLDDSEHLIFDSLKPRQVYELALKCEMGAKKFYLQAAATTKDEELKKVFHDLSEAEGDHADWLCKRLEEMEKTGGR